MNFLKKTGLSVSFLLFSLLANAGETRKTMIVELDGNERVTFALSDISKYWQSGNTLRICSEATQSEFSLCSVSYVHFSALDFTDVNEPLAEQVSLYPNPVQDYLIVSGLKANASVGLTNLEGVLLTAFVACDDGEVRIDVNTLPAGIYFLSISDKSFKFVKK